MSSIDKHTARWAPHRTGVAASCLLGTLVVVAGSTLADAALVGRTRVATGLSAPMFTTFAPGDPTRLFIAERGSPSNSSNATANIRILNLTTGLLESTPFLSIGGVNNIGEGGILGMAFHPDYATNGKFYVNVTANDSIASTPFSVYLREYTVSANPNVANTSFNPVLNFAKPADPNQSNHNGGWIGFSPNDGYLYMMVGDGGSGNDSGTGHASGGNGQSLNTVLGKALRIDVDDVLVNDDFPADPNNNYRIPDSNPFADVRDSERVVTTVVPGRDEIWAYGLRNPFRTGFDRATGDLWIGDVGQDRREEVNFQPGDSDGGENYGWRLREGFIQTPTVGGAKPPGNVDPIWDYKQADAPDVLPGDADFLGQSVIGGVPYRGPDPSLQGVYFFADNASSRLWSLRRLEGGGVDVDYIVPSLPTNVGTPGSPSAISEDANGNLYITYLSGSVYKIETNEFTPGDFNADAKVNDADLALWQVGFGKTTAANNSDGDADKDGDVDGEDFLAWQRNYGYSALDVGGAGQIGVPEPASGAGLAAMAVAGALRLRRGAVGRVGARR